MSSLYFVNDDDEQRIYRKDKSGNFSEIEFDSDEGDFDSETTYEPIAKSTTEAEQKKSVSTKIAYPAFNESKPQEIAKWFNSLSKIEQHNVVQDPKIPQQVLTHIVREARPKLLKVLCNHKNVEPDLRITIMRRIYRSKDGQLNHDGKYRFFLSILERTNLTQKEKQVANSYIGELNKVKPKAKVLSKLKKRAKKKKRAIKAQPTLPTIVYRIPERANSGKIQIARLLQEIYENSLYDQTLHLDRFRLYRDSFTVLYSKIESQYTKAGFSPSTVVLFYVPLMIRIHLDAGNFKAWPSITFFKKQFHDGTHGPLAEKLYDVFDTVEGTYERIYLMLLRLTASDDAEFEQKLSWMAQVSAEFPSLMATIKQRLEVLKTTTTTAGTVTIRFVYSPGMEFEPKPIRLWPLDDPDDVQELGFHANFDAKDGLYYGKVTLVNLEHSASYCFTIDAHTSEQHYQTKPSTFKVPDFVFTEYEYSPSRGYLGVPIGGGGERRHQQF